VVRSVDFPASATQSMPTRRAPAENGIVGRPTSRGGHDGRSWPRSRRAARMPPPGYLLLRGCRLGQCAVFLFTFLQLSAEIGGGRFVLGEGLEGSGAEILELVAYSLAWVGHRDGVKGNCHARPARGHGQGGTVHGSAVTEELKPGVEAAGA